MKIHLQYIHTYIHFPPYSHRIPSPDVLLLHVLGGLSNEVGVVLLLLVGHGLLQRLHGSLPQVGQLVVQVLLVLQVGVVLSVWGDERGEIFSGCSYLHMVHAYIHTYTHTNILYINTYKRIFAKNYYVRCSRKCIPQIHKHTNIHTYMQTYIHEDM